MANTSQFPIAGLPAFHSGPPQKRNGTRLQAVPATAPNPKPDNADDSTSLPLVGPRKLVRPPLNERTMHGRSFSPHQEPAILAHQGMALNAAAHESSNAEAFYFQKQVQTQTRMVIVLEGGEQVEGCIEWYDRNAIKVRGATRMLIYKDGIKYMYKAAERHG
jgi:sRNA-binding regulator protein Hfq